MRPLSCSSSSTMQIMNASSADTRSMEDQIRLSLRDDWGSASVLRENLNGSETVLVGYSIYHGSTAIQDATGVIEAFERRGARYAPVANLTTADLNGFSVGLERLPSPWSTEMWILAHGHKTQVMQYH